MAGTYGQGNSYSTCVLESPDISLTGASNPVLSLFQWLRTETYTSDGGNVKISNDGGSTWTLLTPNGGYDGTVASESAFYGDKSALGWYRETFDLSAYVGDTIKLRFVFYSNSYTSYDGWYIDSLYITEDTDVPVQILTPSNMGVAVTDVGATRPITADGGTGSFDWTMVAGGTNNGWLSIDPGTGTLSGTPMASNVGAVTVTVRATVPGNPTNFAERTFDLQVVAPATLPYTENFDSNPVTWTFGSGEWEWGTPSGTGPTSCHSGSCVGTQLQGDYSNNLTWEGNTITSPPINLSGTTSPTLEFQGWLSTEGSVYDGCNIKISTDGINFTLLTAVTPAYNLTGVNSQACWGEDNLSWQEMWSTYSADLSAYIGQAVWIQFAMRTDGSVTYPGWYLDDISVHD